MLITIFYSITITINMEYYSNIMITMPIMPTMMVEIQYSTIIIPIRLVIYTIPVRLVIYTIPIRLVIYTIPIRLVISSLPIFSYNALSFLQ